MCERLEAGCQKSQSPAIDTEMLILLSQLVYIRQTPSLRQ